MAGQLTHRQLRDFYRHDYVNDHATKENDRIGRLLTLIDWHADDQVLDCACGSGQLLDLIHKRVARYVGVDFSAEFIRKCVEQQAAHGIRNAEFACADLVDYCTAHPREFDKCFALDFSEHIYDDDFVRIFRAIHESLKDGGRLYIHTPSGDYFLEKLKAARILKNDPTHIGVRSGPHLCRLLNEAGFDTPHVQHLAHYVRPLKQLHALSAIPGIGRWFRARLFITCRKRPTKVDQQTENAREVQLAGV
jgi:cyclopropane fatty-acyl-phospholipid synthase-like methyltransferase